MSLKDSWSAWCLEPDGWHSSFLRAYEGIREIFGWKRKMPSASTLSRFFQKFDLDLNDLVFPGLQKQWFEQISVTRHTIDVDSTVIQRYGVQEGAGVGFNPQHRGGRSHHPLMAFSEEASMVVNAWQRDGNTSDKTDACHFLEETLDILGRSGVGLVRMDAGFYSRHIMSFLEGDGEGTEPVDYIVRAHMTKRVYNAISEVTNWYSSNKVSNHAAYAEIAFKGASW